MEEKAVIPPEAEKLFMEIKTPVVFATIDAFNGFPHATPMNWLWLEKEKVFWFNPAGKTRKLSNMKKNKSLCFGTVEDMEKGKRGFIVEGEIVKFEEGLIGLIKNLLTKRRMLVEKSEVYFNLRTLKFWVIYAFHRDIYYSTVPWNAAFVRVKPMKIKYWLDNGEEKEVILDKP